jgi:hypothetical protein
LFFAWYKKRMNTILPREDQLPCLYQNQQQPDHQYQ